MTLESLIILIAVGLVAGWLAGLIWKGSGFGLLWNIIFGVCGSFLGNWLFRLLGIYIGNKWIAMIVPAVVGALIILAIVNLIRRNR